MKTIIIIINGDVVPNSVSHEQYKLKKISLSQPRNRNYLINALQLRPEIQLRSLNQTQKREEVTKDDIPEFAGDAVSKIKVLIMMR